MEKFSPSKYVVKDFLIPFGSILISAIALLTGYHKLSKWAITGIYLYIIFIVVMWLYDPLHRLWTSFHKKRKDRNFAKKFHPGLYDISREFGQLIEDNRGDTIFYLLQNINSWEELRGQLIQPDAEHISTIRSWHASIEKNFNFYRKKNFPSLAWELSSLIFQHNRFCVQAERRLEGIIRDGKLNEIHLRYLKQEWTLCPERYGQFISKWENLAKNINEKFQERVCIDYYEPIKTLE